MTNKGKPCENNNAPTKYISTHCDIACISQEKNTANQYSVYTADPWFMLFLVI